LSPQAARRLLAAKAPPVRATNLRRLSLFLDSSDIFSSYIIKKQPGNTQRGPELQAAGFVVSL
jgi:hypothetical protein